MFLEGVKVALPVIIVEVFLFVCGPRVVREDSINCVENLSGHILNGLYEFLVIACMGEGVQVEPHLFPNDVDYGMAKSSTHPVESPFEEKQ
jgi:hypothetical protein